MNNYQIRAYIRRFLQNNKLLTASTPPDLQTIAALINADIYETNELPIEISGLSLNILSEHSYSIAINNRIEHEGHRRFTLAHELGHILLGHLKDNRILCTSINTIMRVADPVICRLERSANIAASEILMPTPLIKKHARILNNDVIALSNYFKTSKMAMEIRLKEIA